jgi:hypothetical protein
MSYVFDGVVDIFPGKCTPGDMRIRWNANPLPSFISVTA